MNLGLNIFDVIDNIVKCYDSDRCIIVLICFHTFWLPCFSALGTRFYCTGTYLVIDAFE